MASPSILQTRLKDLSASLGHMHPLITRLWNFTTAIGQGDQARLELGAEIHTRLKEAEEEMELLRVEIEALEPIPENRRRGANNEEKEAERERIVSLAGRLEEDLKRTRGEFRRAQLQAKRNAELAKRKERELLFSRSANAEAEGVRQTSEKLTQDELMVNASNDVTSALKRTYYLMQAELSRSQFAQQTLEQSNAALASLSESYGGLDSLLSSSRSLVGSLLRSQKSDTWYLETAFYVLVGTIIWLIFRRILYGPFWWLVWFPMRLIARFTLAVLGAVGLTSTNALQSSATASLSSTLTPGFVHKTEVPAIESVTGSASWNQEPVTTEGDRLIDRIGKMATGEAEMEETNVDDISPEERKRQEEMPRNSKKRMYEEVINENRRDEL